MKKVLYVWFCAIFLAFGFASCDNQSVCVCTCVCPCPEGGDDNGEVGSYIVFPERGRFGTNILADEFVEANRYGTDGRF